MMFCRAHVRLLPLALAGCLAVGATPAVAVSPDPGRARLPEVASSAGDFKQGDTPADYPGASRYPKYDAPQTISVIRPERTIVHDAEQTLPIALAGVALLLSVGGLGIAVTNARVTRTARP